MHGEVCARLTNAYVYTTRTARQVLLFKWVDITPFKSNVTRSTFRPKKNDFVVLKMTRHYKCLREHVIFVLTTCLFKEKNVLREKRGASNNG